MTTGAVIIAINNEQIDYVSLAAWNSQNIRRHLGIPVAVLTDDVGVHAASFDRVISVDRPKDAGVRNINLAGRAIWYNTNRVDAYDLSPWTRTIVLDADYVVASDALNGVIESDLAFAAHRHAYDVTGRNDFRSLNTFGSFAMPMWWATVMIFNRCAAAEIVFDCMRMIRNNWNHFRNLYGNRQALYRNDHALSIALAIESGHTLVTTDIPWSLATVMPDCTVSETEIDHYLIEYTDSEGRPRRVLTANQDLHVMAKDQLERIIGHHT